MKFPTTRNGPVKLQKQGIGMKAQEDYLLTENCGKERTKDNFTTVA